MMLPMGRVYRRRRLIVGGATLLLVGGAAYKIGTSQAKKIEEHTGKPPEDLSQAELEHAMDELGIEEQELTAADKAAIEAEAVAASPTQAPAAPAGRAAPGAASGAVPAAATGPATPSAPPGTAPPKAPQAAPAAAQPDYIEELRKLAGLKDAGIISEAEFEAKKKQLLGL